MLLILWWLELLRWGRKGLFLRLSTIEENLREPIFLVGLGLGFGGFVGGLGLCC